jgi:preprotein translocase subunit SecE
MILNLKSERTPNPSLDWLKWSVAVLLLIAMMVANYYFSAQSVPLRIAGNIVAGLLVLGVFSLTEKGKRFWVFAGEAKNELRKVVWPTRQEAMQSTLLIVIFVVIAGLFLWGIDSFLLWAVSFFTGQ